MENTDNNKKETKSVENLERVENVEKWLAIRNEWERRAKTETKTITDLTNLATDIWNHVISLKDGEDIYNDSSSAASSLALAGKGNLPFVVKYCCKAFSIACIFFKSLLSFFILLFNILFIAFIYTLSRLFSVLPSSFI